MRLSLFQVDVFTGKLFAGNPAAVIPLKRWLGNATLQKIALENNLSETAYFVKTNKGFHIRWFTPKAEVDLCGHATLATSFVLFNLLRYKKNILSFESRSGKLTVTKNKNWLTLNFPTDKIEKINPDKKYLNCFNIQPSEIYQGKEDLMFIYKNKKQVETIIPDFEKIKQLGMRGIIITAKGSDTDFVSRFFCPAYGINEDPATGSAHTTLTPYWSKRLNKIALIALQLSERGAYFKCKYLGERVEISGEAVLYMKGEISI